MSLHQVQWWGNSGALGTGVGEKCSTTSLYDCKQNPCLFPILRRCSIRLRRSDSGRRLNASGTHRRHGHCRLSVGCGCWRCRSHNVETQVRRRKVGRGDTVLLPILRSLDTYSQPVTQNGGPNFARSFTAQSTIVLNLYSAGLHCIFEQLGL